MSRNYKLGLGASLLTGVLALGSGAQEAYAQERPARPDTSTSISGLFTVPWGRYCQMPRVVCPTIIPRPTAIDSPRTKADSAQQRRYMNSLGELTMAGSGRLMADYIQPLDLSSTTDLNGIFSARGLQFSFNNAKQYLENIARNMGSDSSLTGTERAFRNYIGNLARHTPRSNPASLRILNQAVRDGTIWPSELRDSNGRLLVENGYYMLVARKGRESVPILFHAENYSGRTPVTETTRQDTSRIRTRVDSLRTDSTARARQTARDSTARENLRRQIAERSARATADSTARARRLVKERTHKPRPGVQVGLEAQFGTNQELELGAFANARVIPGIRLEAFANYTLPSQSGNLYLNEQSTDTTIRARENLGDGVYRFRTDDITTLAEETGIAEAGLGLTVTPFRFLDLFVREGAKLLEREETISGRSTIGFERDNLPSGTPQVITNTRENSSYVTRPSFTAGARINLNKRLSLTGSYNRVGSQNRGKAGLRFTF